LQQMALPADTKLTPSLTRELCLRAGSKVYIAGSIGSLGTEYVLGLKAINCQNGDTLAQQQVWRCRLEATQSVGRVSGDGPALRCPAGTGHHVFPGGAQILHAGPESRP